MVIPSASPIIEAFRRHAASSNLTVALASGNTDLAPIPEEQIALLPEPPLLSSSKTRRLQHVATIGQRLMVMKWMKEEVERFGDVHIPSKAVKTFPECFRGAEKANLQKASRWFKEQQVSNAEQVIERKSISCNQTGGSRKRIMTKALAGRGPKRSLRVEWLHLRLLEEFRRLSKAHVKFSPKVLLSLAKDILQNAGDADEFSSASIENGILITEKLTSRWILTFQERFDIVLRHQTGKLAVSPAHHEHMEKLVAFHLGEVGRRFRSGDLDENLVENVDETHFVINMDNGRTLGFKGDDDVKYADVSSGGEGMTMIVRVTGGSNAAIQPPMMIFMNKSRSYPIRGVPDDVAGVCYRTGPKGWNDSKVFPLWCREPRAIRKDPHGGQREIFMDNCGCHNVTDDLTSALNDLNAVIRKLPANATHLCQPCDSFVISKIKQEWSNAWESYKIDMIKRQLWAEGSGKLQNPGKRFFLKLAAESVRKVNHMRDRQGLTYARKAMIRCGLSLNINGLWEESQLFPVLQEIIKKYPEHYEGCPVGPRRQVAITENPSF
uniref:DDE-1 domain-containing protein n=1 Tax=Spongospora subterranea TaxID=70186 RepID=A0A0H5QVN4_9EUKA|eukprot:CRZ05975.1 hypothetical protein [Spongospora subterranea]